MKLDEVDGGLTKVFQIMGPGFQKIGGSNKENLTKEASKSKKTFRELYESLSVKHQESCREIVI